MKKQTILENYIYVTDKKFTFELEDEKSRQFGILFEITDMDEATGEEEFADYPFVVSASIVADKCHKSFYEGDGKPDKLGLIYDSYSYMGGVPVDHILTHNIQSSNETGGSAFEAVAKSFTPFEAKVSSVKADFGTVAAQNGRGYKHEYLQFKTFEAAEKFVDYLIEHRIDSMGMLIGFTLDRPINMIGETGWSVMEKMVKGCK